MTLSTSYPEQLLLLKFAKLYHYSVFQVSIKHLNEKTVILGDKLVIIS